MSELCATCHNQPPVPNASQCEACRDEGRKRGVRYGPCVECEALRTKILTLREARDKYRDMLAEVSGNLKQFDATIATVRGQVKTLEREVERLMLDLGEAANEAEEFKAQRDLAIADREQLERERDKLLGEVQS